MIAVAAVIIYWVKKENSYVPVILKEGDSWEWAGSSECQDLGGKMVEGMGCVRGNVPENLKFNQYIEPQKVKEDCKNSNGTYDKNKNLCLTFHLN